MPNSPLRGLTGMSDDDLPDCVMTIEVLETPQGIYDAVSFLVRHIDSDPAIVCGLASVMCDCLRRAPPDMRGAAADRVLGLIRDDVRRSLQ